MTVTKTSRWRSRYELRDADGALRGRLGVHGFRSHGAAELDGERYELRPSRGFRRRVAMTAASGEQVARVEGRRVSLRGGAELEWKRLGGRGSRGFVDSSGAPVVRLHSRGRTTQVESHVPDAPLLALLGTYLTALESLDAGAVAGAVAAAA